MSHRLSRSLEQIRTALAAASESTRERTGKSQPVAVDAFVTDLAARIARREA